MMKNKAFDCVKMKHDIQQKIYEDLKPVSIDDYFDKLTKAAHKSSLWQELQSRPRAKSA